MVDISRRRYLAAVGSVPVIGAVAGCLGGGGTGTLSTQVTDQPGDIADFESCVITIVGMWLGPEDAEAGDTEDEEPSGREYHEYDEPQEADLVQLQDGETQLVDERSLDTGTYQFLQLDTDGVAATLADGTAATVEVPGDAPLTFNKPFDIREDTRTTFTADFTPVQRGGTGTYLLQPVPSGITVEYGN
ncbi:MAG: DUF4382 domain-containing protein [Halobacteriales archaeon]|nr:DUF4382 domain-containing protein [Halobacteriales archaeon]